MSSIPPVGPTTFSQLPDPRGDFGYLISQNFEGDSTLVKGVLLSMQKYASGLQGQGLKDLINNLITEYDSYVKEHGSLPPRDGPGQIAFAKLMGTAKAAYDVSYNPSIDRYSKALESLHQLYRFFGFAPIGISPDDLVKAMNDSIDQLKTAPLPPGVTIPDDVIKSPDGYPDNRSAIRDTIRDIGTAIGGNFNL